MTGRNKKVAEVTRGVMRDLVDWSRNILGDLDKRICRTKKELERCRQENIRPEQVRREEVLRFKLGRLEEQKETYWRQRAQVHWLKCGDRNTKNFHAAASERKRRNKIRRLRKEDGTVVEEEGAMKEVVTNYFLNLFTSRAGTRTDELLGQINPRVTPQMNALLGAAFTDKEVVDALHSIGDLKAPGPDGPMPEGWNDTCVVLIPKVQNPESMKDLRPISLCNVVYKLISKNKRTGKDGYAAVKLDMSKAYDRVEWGFLEKMMYKLGFEERWIKVVMLCISTLSYRFKVNGECTDVVVPQRGLRQGDPLSPYLFLIVAEDFSAMLNNAEREGLLNGIRICNGAPSLNHLLFADDSLVLMKASRECAIHLQYMLNLYEVCSGQVVNFDKSSVMFSKNTSAVQKQHVLAELRIGNVTRSERYLGLPVHVGMNKTKMFEYLKERMWNHIQGWLERLMSKAAKDVLTKACAQAIPTFAMSCFDLTKTLCEQMGEMICRFWWAKQEKTRTMHWLSWELMTRSKEEGGLGFRDLHGFNLAMLAKQAWRILTEPESLCAWVLKAKYFPNTSVLEAQANPGISYTWSILKGVELLKEGLICRIGDGTSVKIWSDPWLNREGSRLPKTMRGRCLLTRVCELFDPDTGSWDEQLVRNIFIGEDVKVILSTPIRDVFDDFYAWFPDSKGTFRVKSAYLPPC